MRPGRAPARRGANFVPRAQSLRDAQRSRGRSSCTSAADATAAAFAARRWKKTLPLPAVTRTKALAPKPVPSDTRSRVEPGEAVRTSGVGWIGVIAAAFCLRTFVPVG